MGASVPPKAACEGYREETGGEGEHVDKFLCENANNEQWAQMQKCNDRSKMQKCRTEAKENCLNYGPPNT